MGLGNFAFILVPGVRVTQSKYSQAKIDVLTYGACVELMKLLPEINALLAITKKAVT